MRGGGGQAVDGKLKSNLETDLARISEHAQYEWFPQPQCF